MLKLNSSSYFSEKKIPQIHETYSGDFPRTDTMNSNIHQGCNLIYFYLNVIKCCHSLEFHLFQPKPTKNGAN